MAVLPDVQIAAVARQAGFTGQPLVRAVGVALAESQGNTTAHNTKPPDNSYGLWQINMYGNLGPARRSQYGISSNDALYDPATNARAAARVYNDAGRSFTPWSVYSSGRYLGYMPRALKAVNDMTTLGLGGGTPNTSPPAGGGNPGALSWGGLPDLVPDNPLDAVNKAVSFITEPRNWTRLAMFIGGGLAVLVGLSMLLAETLLSKVASSVVKKVIRNA